MTLPMEKPWFTTYPIFANPLSIIQQFAESHNWILSSFILPVCNGGEALSFFDFNYRTCPFLTVQRVSKNVIMNRYDLIDILKMYIREGFYAYLIINPSHI